MEIGSAYGFFLNLAKNRFKTVFGIDISQSGVDYAREQLKLNACNEDFLKHDFLDERFDVVCLWDTIEHLRDPHLYLEKASRLMTKGGLIAITTGDIQSVNARWRKEKWRFATSPRRMAALFFKKSRYIVCSSAMASKVIYNKYCGFYRSIDNIAYNILILRNRKKFIYDFLNE